MPYWLSGDEMEREIAKKLTEHGFDVRRNVKIGSLSPDILAKDENDNYVIIEVKGAPVGSMDVARVNAMLHDFPLGEKRIDALILTNRSATTDAKKIAKKIGVKIISESSLPRLSEKVLSSLRMQTR